MPVEHTTVSGGLMGGALRTTRLVRPCTACRLGITTKGAGCGESGYWCPAGRDAFHRSHSRRGAAWLAQGALRRLVRCESPANDSGNGGSGPLTGTFHTVGPVGDHLGKPVRRGLHGTALRSGPPSG